MAQAERSRARSPILMATGPVLPPVIGDKRRRGDKSISSLPMPLHDRRVMGPALSSSHPYGLTLLETLPPVLALLCCPGKEQCLISQVLQLVRGRDSSPALMTSGPALLLQVVVGEKMEKAPLPCHANTHAADETQHHLNSFPLSGSDLLRFP